MKAAWQIIVLTAATSIGGAAYAQTEIKLLDQQYTTDLSIKAFSWDPATNKTTVTTNATQLVQSASVLSNTLQGSARVYAQAQATTFAVGTSTSALGDVANNEVSAFARADAESMLSFRTLQDTMTPLQFSVVGSGLSFYSDGFFSLFDRTAAEYVFAYSWSSGSIPKYPPPSGATPITWLSFNQASVDVQPLLLRSHVYDLTLHASTNANTDSQDVSLQASGLVPIAAPVPEPSEIALMLTGLVGVSVLIRLARRRP